MKEGSSMLKAMIVDDDALIRNMIRSLVDWQALGFEVAAEAVDGIDAIEKIDQLVPDLLVLDISMPQMDGLGVIRHIREMQQDIKIIVLSCHDEFPYVREAMVLDADEYLLKHMLSPENIGEAVDKMKQKILEERSMKKHQRVKQRQAEEGTRRLRSEALFRLLRARELAMDILDGIRTYDRPLMEEPCGLILYSVADYSRVFQAYEPNGEEILGKALENIVLEIAQGSFEARHVPMGGGHFAIVATLATASRAKVKDELMTLAKRLAYAFDAVLDVRGRFVLSVESLSYRQLPMAYRRLVSLESSFFYEEAAILSDDAARPVAPFSSKLPQELVEKVRKLVGEKDFSGLAEWAAELHEDLVERRIDPEDFKRWHEGLAGEALSFAAFRYKLKPDQEKKQAFLEAIAQAENERELLQAFKSLAAGLEATLAGGPEEGIENALIREAVAYIQTHYMENISLTELAHHLKMNSAYLSHLFKETTQCNFVDYVKETRIRKACEFLEHSDMKIKEVSEAVGIPNRKYFSKIFKKATGMTPQEYRTRL